MTDRYLLLATLAAGAPEPPDWWEPPAPMVSKPEPPSAPDLPEDGENYHAWFLNLDRLRRGDITLDVLARVHNLVGRIWFVEDWLDACDRCHDQIAAWRIAEKDRRFFAWRAEFAHKTLQAIEESQQ